MRVSEVLTLLSLIALCYPKLFLMSLGDSKIFLHYIILIIALPILFLRYPKALKPVLLVIGLIVFSSFVNASSVSLSIAVFHILHLIGIALLASCPKWLALSFAKITILVYAVSILVVQLVVWLGFPDLVSLFLVQKEGLLDTRVLAFATEPSYAGMIIMILCRFVIIFDLNWIDRKRMILIISSLIATLSLFSLLAAAIIFATYLLAHSKTQAVIGLIIGAVVLFALLSISTYFSDRLNSMDFSMGILGLGTGTPRLLPYLFLASLYLENPFVILLGAGAGSLEPAFFEAMGMYRTEREGFATHMAGAIYDYGILVVMIMIFSWNRPTGFLPRSIFIFTVLTIFLNTGMGTYLFLVFGTFALLERRLRRTLAKP